MHDVDAKLTRTMWKQVSTSPAYVSGMQNLAPFGDEVLSNPNLQQILEERDTLSAEVKNYLHPDIFVLAFAAQLHVEVLNPHEYRVLTAAYSMLMALLIGREPA